MNSSSWVKLCRIQENSHAHFKYLLWSSVKLLRHRNIHIYQKWYPTRQQMLCYHVSFLRCGTPHKNSVSSTDKQPSREIYKTAFVRLWDYVAKHQEDWDTIVQQFTYGCIKQIRLCSIQTQISFIFSLQNPGPLLLGYNNAVASETHDQSSSQVLRTSIDARIRTSQAKVDALVQNSQQR